MKEKILLITALLLGSQICFAEDSFTTVTTEQLAAVRGIDEDFRITTQTNDGQDPNFLANLLTPTMDGLGSIHGFKELSDEQADQIKVGVIRFAKLTPNQYGLLWPGVVGVFGGVPAATWTIKGGETNLREMSVNTLCGAVSATVGTVWGNSQLAAMGGDNIRTYDRVDQGLSLLKNVVLPALFGGCKYGLDKWFEAADNASANNTRVQIGNARNATLSNATATAGVNGRRLLEGALDSQDKKASTYLDNIEFYKDKIEVNVSGYLHARWARHLCWGTGGLIFSCWHYENKRADQHRKALRGNVRLMEKNQREYVKIVKSRAKFYGINIKENGIPRKLRIIYNFTTPSVH